MQNRFWQHSWNEQKITKEIPEIVVADSEVALKLPEPPKPVAGDLVSQRYRKSCKPRKPHKWRTRMDPFEPVNDKLMLIVRLNPQITAKQLLQILQKEQPGEFESNLLRTLQRRLKEWRYELIAAAQKPGLSPMPEINSVILLESTDVNSVI